MGLSPAVQKYVANDTTGEGIMNPLPEFLASPTGLELARLRAERALAVSERLNAPRRNRATARRRKKRQMEQASRKRNRA
jgi:hypothetical protein